MENLTNWCVYMHENRINGKKYIGITSQKPTNRWDNGRGYVHCRHFYAAIQKHGWDAFRHEILYTGLTQAEAEELEIELIAKYQTQDSAKGYNITPGGQPTEHTDETRQRISDALLGRKLSDEHRAKDSEAHRGEKNNRYGTRHTPETIEKMRATAKGRKFSPETLEKMSAAKRGRHLSEEHKRAISSALQGKTYSKGAHNA